MSATPSNFISEWYGVRLYPSASGAGTSSAIELFENKRCPFLSNALEEPTACIKNRNSSGVCTITTTKNKLSDWIVCPYRVLEKRIVDEVARKIFSDSREDLPVYPAVHLQDESRCSAILERASRETVYIFFQDKLGGEINVSGSDVTPELSFDITIMECYSESDWLFLKRYGLFEVQTMDFHGSYRHAVSALENAVDLHRDNFGVQLENNHEWSGRRIEGPNIANVFKRTVYQLILKFDLAGRDRCAGVVLGLPEAVWESWAPHFGGLDWAGRDRDHERMDGGGHVVDKSWILVLAPEQRPSSGHSRMEIRKEVQVDAQTLVHRAFTVVPEVLARESLPGLSNNIVRRTRRFYKNTQLGDD